MKLKYMRDNTPDTYGILSLQDKILEIAVYIDDFCRRHDIVYCLTGGSALGAKRHAGFIPWDDDMDIFMTPENYSKFRNAFHQCGDSDRFYLQEMGEFPEGMVKTPKLRMNGTTFIEGLIKDWDMHHGVYVDIFILHACPDKWLQQMRLYVWAKYLVLRALANRGYNRRGGLAGLVVKVIGLLPHRFLVNKALREVYRYRGRSTNYYCDFLGKAGFRSGIFRREWLDDPRYVHFEKVMLKAPSRLHEFLSTLYNDYMTIPAKARIKWDQHAWKWDVSKHFDSYVPWAVRFDDEKRIF